MIRILVVDDDASILELYSLILDGPAYDLTLAASGEAAVKCYADAWASGRVFDLAMIDLTIKGGIGGNETLQRLLQINPDVQAVVSSGLVDESLKKACQESGFVDILPKPFSPGQLVSVIQRVLDRKS